jgi:hypothetical protein
MELLYLCLSFNFNNFNLSWSLYDNFFSDFFDCFIVDDAFDFIDNFFDSLSTDLDLSRYFDSSFDFKYIMNKSVVGSFLSDWNGNRNLFLMFKFNYSRYLYQSGSGDKLVDGYSN